MLKAFRSKFYMGNKIYKNVVFATNNAEAEKKILDKYKKCNDLVIMEINIEQKISECERLIAKYLTRIDSRNKELLNQKRVKNEYLSFAQTINKNRNLNLFKITFTTEEGIKTLRVVAENVENIILDLKEKHSVFEDVKIIILNVNIQIETVDHYIHVIKSTLQETHNNLIYQMEKKAYFLYLQNLLNSEHTYNDII